jgi:H+/gluconate symporter-like permease
MRPYAGEPEQDPLGDHQLPGLVVSILPVVLPVILISMNTVATTLADAERAARFRDPSEVGWVELGVVLEEAAVDPSGSRAARRLLEELPKSVSGSLRQAARTETTPSDLDEVLAALNRVLASREFHAEPELLSLTLPDEGTELLGSDVRKLSLAQVERLNRFILEASLPEIIRPHEWETPRRQVANVTSLFGNANLALFLSAAIAMWVLVRNRKLGLPELAKTTETALMSGGVIILITAAGGAFGAMLKAANVGDVIESMAGGGGQTSGLAMLLIAFGVTSVLKIAQGSSTVAMITSSGMLAAMGTSAEQLGFHPVYLAAAIGSGSLVTSWMNDSGFWIFTRMSALTEVEGLKTWSAATAFAGFVGFGFTILFAWLLPLV